MLTNRWVVSSAEDFVLAMTALPQVTVLGDTTGGGTGNPVTRTLPNGWTYQVSRWIGYDAERVAFEDRGIAPDVAVQGSAEQTGSEDLIIDSAIARLRNGGAG